MAAELRWSPEAIEDIESIAAYIERDSASYAAAVVDRILATAESIPDQQRLGRAVPEIGDPDIRERFVYSYRLIYQIKTDSILLAAVVHGRSELETRVSRIAGAPET